MTVGLDLISAVMQGNQGNAFRDIAENIFLEDELRIYQFVKNHFRQHGVIPNIETIEANGMGGLGEVPEPYTYYLEECKIRAVYNGVQNNYESLRSSMDSRDREGMVSVLRDMLHTCTSINIQDDLMRVQDEAREVLLSMPNPLRDAGLLGITLGFPLIDTITQGAHGGDVVIIAGRPNIGKSWVLLKSAYEAWRDGNKVLLVSMEMTKRQMTQRLMALHTGISPNLIRTGQISTNYLPIFQNQIYGFDNMEDLHLMSGNFKKTAADIDVIVQEIEPDIVYIDAGYLIQPSRQSNNRQRRETIAESMEELKGLAVARDVPVVSSVQFNRNVKNNTKGTPDLSNIAETDVIGQIASVVLAITHGLAPQKKSSRRLRVIKNREGEVDIDYFMHFKFDRMNLDAFSTSELEDIRHNNLDDDDDANAESRNRMEREYM